MFPDFNKEIRVDSKTDQLSVNELIVLLDHIGEELSRDHITEQYAQYLTYVSTQLREMRKVALEVVLEAEEEEEQAEAVHSGLPDFKKQLPH